MNTPMHVGASMLKSLVKLREQKGTIRIEDLGEMLTELAASLHVSSQPEQFLRGEFQKIAEHIETAKLEIASLLQVEGETSPQHIGHASNQLDAVVKMTEEATNQIMDSADKIQQAVDSNDPDMHQTVSNAVADIYLACNFQDITSQRITKVLRTLEYIDTKVHSIMELFGAIGEGNLMSDQASSGNPASPSDASLLNGPALPADAPSQEEIDALFSSIRLNGN